jgi:CxxC motif-containing protein (DUF1111 family)
MTAVEAHDGLQSSNRCDRCRRRDGRGSAPAQWAYAQAPSANPLSRLNQTANVTMKRRHISREIIVKGTKTLRRPPT